MKNIDIPSHANALWRTLSFGDFTEIGHRQIRDAMEALGEEYRAELLAREDQIERLKGHEMAQKENMQHHPRALAYFENHGVLGAYLGKNWIEALCIEAETLRARLNEVEQTATERVADAEQGERNANTEHAALLKKYENLHAAAIRAINLLPTNGEAALELVRHIENGGHEDRLGDLQAEVASCKTIINSERAFYRGTISDRNKEIQSLKAHGDDLEKERQVLELKLAQSLRVALILASCVQDVSSLSVQSEGVAGFFLNGKVASWEYLKGNEILESLNLAAWIADALITYAPAIYEIGEASIKSKPDHFDPAREGDCISRQAYEQHIRGDLMQALASAINASARNSTGESGEFPVIDATRYAQP